ncbi:MAG: EcsC family protein [SAR324 cluster bacterium]|nr:EcsC family protein [SAR324 cluster bacterium]
MGTDTKDSMILKILDWAFENALEPEIPSMDSAYQMAQHYLKQEGSLEDQVNLLIRTQSAKSATSGFITGLGGIITLPVVIPADISAVLFIEVRMILTIAIMGGHDPNNETVKMLVYACLSDSVTEEVLNAISTEVGIEVLEFSVNRLSLGVIRKSVGGRLAVHFGSKGFLHLARGIPVLGGIIWGTLDAVDTNRTGNNARKLLISRKNMEDHKAGAA